MKQFLTRILMFLGVFAVAFTVLLFVLANLPRPVQLGFKHLNAALNTRIPGDITFAKHHEAMAAGEVDVLFLGSSHSYRTFDPRYFAERGISSFNWGTTSQSPINTYYLLQKYYETLNPKLVVIETFPHLYAASGSEAILDLMINLPSSTDLWQMTWSTGDFRMMLALVLHWMDLDVSRYDQIKPVSLDSDEQHYITGGYVEADSVMSGAAKETFTYQPLTGDPERYQIDYLVRTIEFCREQGSEVILTTVPVFRDSTVDRYDEYITMLRQIAREQGVPYFVYDNRELGLEQDDFYDWHHMNVSGVTVFLDVFWLDTVSLFDAALSN